MSILPKVLEMKIHVQIRHPKPTANQQVHVFCFLKAVVRDSLNSIFEFLIQHHQQQSMYGMYT